MYDPKFEKDVQRKMEELEFSPSEAVWANIEREVNRDKERRRVPFFWLFLAPALLLGGAGIGYFAFHPASKAGSGTISGQPAGHAAAPNVRSAAPVVRPTAPASQVMVPSDRTRLTSDKPLSGRTAGTQVPAAGGATASAAEKADGAIAKATEKTDGVTAGAAEKRGKAAPVRDINVLTGNEGVTMSDATIIPVGNTGDAEAQNTVAKSSGTVGLSKNATRVHETYAPGLARPFLPGPAITATGLKSPGTAFAGQDQKAIRSAGPIATPARPWEAAFTGGIGVSTFQQPLLKGLGRGSLVMSDVNNPTRNPAFAAPTGAINGAPSKNYTSDIQPDLSFSAGILARKPLSRRWAVTIGLNLEYYSARLRIGQQVSSFIPQSTSLIYSAATAPVQAYPYYSTGNEQVFVNKYYFLEIPASVQWQVNHSKLMPLFWEGGASLSYLMSSDALYYDPSSAVYYKDGGVIDRMQVNLSTSLMLGLPMGGVRLQVGPQVQYGVTGLLKTQTSDGQHLLYGGIRFIVQPIKRKK